MIFHENRLLADENIIPYFCQKVGKMALNLLSAAVVIGLKIISHNMRFPTMWYFDKC